MQHLPVTANAILQGFRIVRMIKGVYQVSAITGPIRQRFTAVDRNNVALHARNALVQTAQEKHGNAILRYRLHELAIPGMIVAIASGRIVVVERLKQ